MITHHLQKQILYHLVTSEHALFSELKPAEVESNVFTYHLQQLIKQKYVRKQDDGSYVLTPDGKAVGINIRLTAHEALQQAHSVLFMALKTGDGWLVRKRLAHPMFGKVGFVHGEPVATEPVTVTAQKIFENRTGLTANFKVAGGGYVRLMAGDSLESFTHFTLLFATSATGDFRERADDHPNGQNFWLKTIDGADPNLIPSMAELCAELDAEPALFFKELDFTL
jgi:hypothetical protein